MTNTLQPRYPIFIPSRGRYLKARALTIRCLLDEEVPFRVVVEEEEREQYAEIAGEERLLVLPESGNGLYWARNWIKDFATAEGAERHWQLDDNIIEFRRLFRGERIPCNAGLALRVCEDFTDRYENVAVSGLNYQMFVTSATKKKPFQRNCHVYSCTLINNAIPHRWRLLYNDDTDFCLQVLADGWCTVLVNAFMANKMRTMAVSGGNTDDLYKIEDGRLRMARSLERMWPYVVEVDRRFQRPQHVVRGAWRKFDTELILKPGIDLASMSTDEYGTELIEAKPLQSATLRKKLLD